MKRLSIILLAALAATPFTSRTFDGAALMEKVPALKVLVPFGVATLFTYGMYRDFIERQENNTVVEAQNEKYREARNKAKSKAEELIRNGTLVVPADQTQDLFIENVIDVAASSKGNIFTENLDKATIETLKKGYTFEDHVDADAAGIGTGIILFSYGCSAYNLYNLLTS